MKLVVVLLALQGLPTFLIACAFVFQRVRNRGQKRRDFYPSTYALGIAFQQIQQFVAPNTEYTIAEKLKEVAEEDGEGDSDDPARCLERQLRRIRRGERLETLTTLMTHRS